LLADKIEYAVNRWRSEPFDWATANCCFSVADYVHHATGCDPARVYRDLVSDETSCMDVVEQEGGVLELVGRMMGENGFNPGPMKVGAVVVVDIHGVQICGIVRGNGNVIVRMPRGIFETRSEVLESWPLD